MKKWFTDIAFYLLGGALIALGISNFAVPNNIAAGGFSGIATLANYLFKIPVGITVLVMNIPVFIIGVRKFGWKFLCRTFVATVIMSVMIDLAAAFIPVYSGDRLLSALFAGALGGIGYALVFMRDSTTGGVDIIAKIVHRRFPNLSLGKVIAALDGIVVLLAGLVYRNIESSLYAAVMIFVQTMAVDTLTSGLERGKLVLISSKHNDEISAAIMSEMKRGVTILHSMGAYSKKEQPTLMCAVRTYETAKLREIIRRCDKGAFVITLDSSEIRGEGFHSDAD